MKLKYNYLFLFFLLAFQQIVVCQNVQYWGQTAENIALARTGAAATGLSALYANIAGLTQLESNSVIVSAEQRFELTELQTLSAGGAIVTNSGIFGVKIGYFGFEDYNEQNLSLLYSRKLMDKLSLGAEIILLQTQIPEFDSQIAATFALGVQTQLSKELLLGVHLYSPIRVELAEGELIPSIYRAGLSYIASKKLRINAELEKNVDFPFRFRGSIDYKFLEALEVRLGYSSEPSSFHFGFGYSFANFSLDAASSYHQVLGFSPVVSLAYQF